MSSSRFLLANTFRSRVRKRGFLHARFAPDEAGLTSADPLIFIARDSGDSLQRLSLFLDFDKIVLSDLRGNFVAYSSR
jgi:hypothetical protein